MRFARLFVVVALLMLNLAAQATVRYVTRTGATPYTTIASAVSASVSGDTVLIGAGVWAENLSVTNRRLTVLGAGWDATQVTTIGVTNAGATGTVIEGVTAMNASNIVTFNNADSVTLRRCRLISTSGTVINLGYAANNTGIAVEDCQIFENYTGNAVALSTTQIVFRNCLFIHGAGNATNRYAFSGNNGNLEVYNCVFLGFLRIFNATGTQPVVFINNIVYDWNGASPAFGNYLAGSMFDYNASDRITPPGTNAILLTSNPFTSYDSTAGYSETSDLRLPQSSQCFDTGHPEITDVDGSRSDMGIYGGPRPYVERGVPAYPFPLSLSISPTLIGLGDSIQVNTSGRVGPRY